MLPSALNFKSFSQTLKHFFLAVKYECTNFHQCKFLKLLLEFSNMCRTHFIQGSPKLMFTDWFFFSLFDLVTKVCTSIIRTHQLTYYDSAALDTVSILFFYMCTTICPVHLFMCRILFIQRLYTHVSDVCILV